MCALAVFQRGGLIVSLEGLGKIALRAVAKVIGDLRAFIIRKEQHFLCGIHLFDRNQLGDAYLHPKEYLTF